MPVPYNTQLKHTQTHTHTHRTVKGIYYYEINQQIVVLCINIWTDIKSDELHWFRDTLCFDNF